MRGEWWRIAPLPKSPAEMEAMIRTSRAGMGGKEIYYYSRTTGIRYLTCQQFAELEHLDDSGLREYLAEIQEILSTLERPRAPRSRPVCTRRPDLPSRFRSAQFHPDGFVPPAGYLPRAV